MTDFRTELNQVLDDIKSEVDIIESVVSAMKQTNTNNVPLRQQVLAMWRDKASASIEVIYGSIAYLKSVKVQPKPVEEVEEEDTPVTKKKAAVPKFSVKKKSK